VRLNRDYPSKILQAISLSDNANPLILKYVRTAKPPLLEPIDIDTYTVALAESSLLEAWQYQRTFPEANETRPRLVHKILEWCLSRTSSLLVSLLLLNADISIAQPRPEPLAQLLAFPFSDYEQTLVHKYALQPSTSLPPSSIPVIQDLVCVRLVQSGQYASAIKLDRRFAASIIPGTTAKMQKAIHERRKMMDELLATLPSVERDLIEVELEAEASGVRTSGTSFFGKGKGKGRANGTTASWDDVVPLSATANGSTGPPKVGLQFGASPIPTISARNDMPRFGGSVSRPPPTGTANGNIFVPLSASTSAPSQTQPQQSPFSSRATHVFPLSSSQSSRTPAPLLGSSGIKYPTPLFSQSARAPPAGVNAPSLFSLAGSANQTRNAFYTPPVTNGVKRSLGEDEPRPVVDVPPAPRSADEPPAPIVNDDDVNMDSDDDYAAASRRADVSHVNGTTKAVPTELSYSVFGNSSEAKQPPTKSRRITRADSEVKMPPGAYFPDDHEISTTTGATTKHQRNPSSSPPPPPVKKTRSSGSRTQKLANEPNLRRSLPGAFIPEEDNEEEDDIAPLPVPSKRPARKPRSTRSAGSEDGEARPTRRSTRLSTASSVTSASPEPPSPQTTTGKVRKSKRPTASKSTSRKK
jgi:hypothetical protein